MCSHVAAPGASPHKLGWAAARRVATCYGALVTVQHAILLGAVIIGASILGARLLSPYEFQPGPAGGTVPAIWRANVMTGTVEFCPLAFESGRYVLRCQ